MARSTSTEVYAITVAMSAALASRLLPLLRRIDPERAHHFALAALRLGLAGRDLQPDDPCLAVSAFGCVCRNPIGLAAGFDKDAVAVLALSQLGFGFIETGTVTPLPQSGNPKPRMFRLEADQGVINRMGFNNAGLEPYRRRLDALEVGPVPVGANVGINKESAVPERDYPRLVAAVRGRVDYVVINVSSPNTPGLRDLQGAERLKGILSAIAEHAGDHAPLFVKIAPDLDDADLEALVETCVEGGAAGLIISNTTLSRPSTLRSPRRREAGGLSGAPLMARSTVLLARAYGIARGRLMLIGVGGVRTGADAFAKICAGANLVQLYTAFAYEGPALIPRLKTELAVAVRRAGYASVQDAVGSNFNNLARMSGTR